MSSIYPLVSWPVGWPTFTVDVLANGVTDTITVSDGVAYGWQTTGPELAPGPGPGLGLYAVSTLSLAYVIETMLNAHSTGINCTAFYGYAAANFVGGSGPGVGIYVENIASDTQIMATSNPAALAILGLAVGDVLGAECIILRRTGGVWRPKFAPPAQLEPTLVAVGSGAMSEYSAATQDRLLFGGRLIWSVVWEYVEAADISRQLLTVADYLPTALRATGDTAGTLDDLLWALANGVIVKLALPPIGTAAVDFRDAVMDVGGSIDRSTYATESATAARRYNVTMAFVETQDWDPGTPL